MCKIPWPGQLSCCPCGFSPDSIDLFIVKLRLQRRRGIGIQLAGLGLASLTFVAWFVTGGIDMAFELGILASGATTIGGIVVFGRGTQQVVRATRYLRTVTAMRQLPVARVLSQDAPGRPASPRALPPPQ